MRNRRSPLYRPDPSVGEDDGVHIQTLTGSLVRMAERAKDYDTMANIAFLTSLKGLSAKHRRELDQFDQKVDRMMEAEIKSGKHAIARATRPIDSK